MRTIFAVLLIVAAGSAAHAADACQNYAKRTELPPSFKTISRSAMGPATMEIKTDGSCTCNDLPAVQRGLGQAIQPADVNFACDAADPSDSKSK